MEYITTQHWPLLLPCEIPHTPLTHTHRRGSGSRPWNVDHRTHSRHPPEQARGTATETDEDGDRGRRRLTKSEVDEDRD